MTFSALLAYVFTAMTTWLPPRQNDGTRLLEIEHVAVAIVRVTLHREHAVEDALWLASVGAFEGSYRIHARGSLGEVGVWQLMPPPLGRTVPKSLEGQAREALARWKELGPCGFTGEGGRPGTVPTEKTCPLAFHRVRKAIAWRATKEIHWVADLP